MPPKKKAQPPLETKKQPAQLRSVETYERILEVAAETLADVGIERLSTNLICERAGLSPPALYQFFPNKYAVLREIGERLMQRQNERVQHWITPDVLAGSVEQLERALAGLILDTYEVTRATTGGVWIMRAMRAVPALQQVRLDSHRMVTEAQTQLLAGVLPQVAPANLRHINRAAVELIYATVEMFFDEAMDTQVVAETVAAMIASYMTRVRQAGRRKA
jgi:AcrR family transcriptional regulator